MNESDIDKLVAAVKKSFAVQYKEILSTTEAMEYTGLSEATLKKMRSERAIPYYRSKGGSKTYFKKSDLDEWMTGCRIASADEIETKANRIAYLQH